MNDFNKTLKDIIKQYRKIGFQTHYWKSKETGEVFVYMRKGGGCGKHDNFRERAGLFS